MLLQLCLFVVTVIELTSSQPTYDVIQQENDVSSCERTEQSCSQVMAAVSQLQRDVAELKHGKPQSITKGTSKDMSRVNQITGTCHRVVHKPGFYVFLRAATRNIYNC